MKLSGLRVVDLSQYLPGPLLTQTMADHGAEVIRVEPPAGEPSRRIGPKQAGFTVYFRNTHRGKRSVRLDLKHPDGREAFLRLAATADVVLESFRPGVVARLGVDYAAVRARNPRAVYCSLSAFGQEGRNSRRAVHDLSMEALAGALSLTPDGPVMPPVPAADMAGSLTALNGILMALLARERGGSGDYVEVAMQDALMAWLAHVTGSVFAEGRAPVVAHERTQGGHAFYAIYRCQDGRHVTLGGAEPKFVGTLLTALGRPDLIEVATKPAGPEQEPIKAFLRETFAQRPRDAWTAWFAERDVAFAPVLDLAEAFAEPAVAERGMLLRDAAGLPHIGLPIRFAEQPGRADPQLAELGADTEALLAQLGYDADALAALRADGVI